MSSKKIYTDLIIKKKVVTPIDPLKSVLLFLFFPVFIEAILFLIIVSFMMTIVIYMLCIVYLLYYVNINQEKIYKSSSSINSCHCF